MIKKGIFGGTFDPIHNGHIHIAYEAVYSLNLDEVIFMPSGNPPHKKSMSLTDAFLRLEMVKMAIREESRFRVSDYEINKKGLNYTYETLEVFNQREKDTEFYFITGVDCLMELNSWKRVEKIFDNCNFVVFNRPGYEREKVVSQKRYIEQRYNKPIIYLDVPPLAISSTEIRHKVKKGQNVSYLLPEGVWNTISQFDLYK